MLGFREGWSVSICPWLPPLKIEKRLAVLGLGGGPLNVSPTSDYFLASLQERAAGSSRGTQALRVISLQVWKGVEDTAEGWGNHWREHCAHRAQGCGHARKAGGGPSVGASHFRKLDKSHGFSGGQDLGFLQSPYTTGVHVMGEVSGHWRV